MDLRKVLSGPRLRDTRWSVQVREVATDRVVAQHRPDELLRTASVGKVFLLVEVAAQLADRRLDPERPLRRDVVEAVADSGLWQHLSTPELPLADVAVLVGAVSDNWATNVLLDLVGLDAVRRRAAALAPGGSALHDHVRDRRTSAHPPTLSEGCASDWARLFAGLAAGSVVSAVVSRTVLDWLAPAADLSMVASAFGLDPLAHVEPDRGVTVWSKTGTDSSVRADVGLVRGPRGTWSYAALCNWDPGTDHRDPAMAAMHELGTALARRVAGP